MPITSGIIMAVVAALLMNALMVMVATNTAHSAPTGEVPATRSNPRVNRSLTPCRSRASPTTPAPANRKMMLSA